MKITDTKDDFEQSSDYTDALAKFIATELYQCEECKEYFDEENDFVDMPDGQLLCRGCEYDARLEATGH